GHDKPERSVTFNRNGRSRCQNDRSRWTRIPTYPTSVLGLIQFRKGNIERAKDLYENAISIAITKLDKSRIRQKLNIELGIYWKNLDVQRSLRFFAKAVQENEGDNELRKRAQILITEYVPLLK
ncbi:tetratricopeptide (TPR) repeat protein, partial [Oxalobacteraceae bacterium GrIS 1.18]